MFGNLLKDFEEDQFFSDPFTAHQEHVRQMMRSFSDPFGRDPFFSITDGRSHGRRGQHGSQVALREDHREGLADRPDTHSFQSSTVMTYSKTGDEPAKIFQASSQTRKAPGGIKETKKAVRDSESGVEKIAVGHHIKDRAHIVKKLKNNKTGNHEVDQEFVNLDESEAPIFNNEWDRKVSKFHSFENNFPLEAPKRQSAHYSTKIGPPDLPRRERNISKMVI
ncbi:myeloid leukemia factor 1 isoform X4 [Pseudophryne corroboree]|uniref:myeloid leukemia factor 1 isoform X4 n=1 Tax=Pseudophryne corroboree TaxID=495146 RepID=UPI003081A6C8